jgi:regulator of extracellular matrix RemA (YlzA/DUF370 family)
MPADSSDAATAGPGDGQAVTATQLLVVVTPRSIGLSGDHSLHGEFICPGTAASFHRINKVLVERRPRAVVVSICSDLITDAIDPFAGRSGDVRSKSRKSDLRYTRRVVLADSHSPAILSAVMVLIG